MKTLYQMILRNADGAAGGGDGGVGGTGGAGGDGQQTPTWFAEHPDEAVRTFLTEQNIGDANVAATKLYHANKALGGSADVIVRPGAEATDEQRNAFYDALGRPKEATAYDFALPAEAKVDENFKTWAQTTFHKNGISNDQAKAIVGDWQKFVGEHQAQTEAQQKLDDDAEIEGLKKTYGSQWDQIVADGQKAQAALGLPEAHLNALARAAGQPAYLALMAALGRKMGGEDGFKNSQGGHGEIAPDKMSKEQAQAEINRLQGDPAFQAKYNDAKHSEHAAAVSRMERLYSRTV